MLKILGHDFLKTEIVRVGPKMRVEPGQVIGSRASKGRANKPFGGIQDLKLEQEIFGFLSGLLGAEQGRAVRQGARNGRNEFR